MAEFKIARSELILGAQKSGKTARAESLAAAWLDRSPEHQAVYIATAQAWDEEMRERIARHRLRRAERVPRMRTVEEPSALARAIGANSRADTLIVVDCLTFWLTALLMPAVTAQPTEKPPPAVEAGYLAMVGAAIGAYAGPLVLISNEIGPDWVWRHGQDAQAFTEALDMLNRHAVQACERVTLMAAGLPITLKGQA